MKEKKNNMTKTKTELLNEIEKIRKEVLKLKVNKLPGTDQEMIDFFDELIQDRADFYDDWITGIDNIIKCFNLALKDRYKSEAEFVNKTSILEVIKDQTGY